MNNKLIFIYGTMEAGKSARLLMDGHALDIHNIGVLCMKPLIDSRDGDGQIKSRIGISRSCLSISKEDDLYVIINKCIQANDETLSPLKWIFIDESQFLTKKQVEQLRSAVDELGVSVKCYGLKTDFRTQLFEGSKRLLEVSDEIEELRIPCECGRKAIFNARFNEIGMLVIDGEQILIGGEDKYEPMCSKCFNKKLSETKN